MNALYRFGRQRMQGAVPSFLLLSTLVQAAEVQPLFQAEVDALGQQLAYPGGAPAQLTGAIVILAPGESTGWHTHEIPVMGYLLEGELQVRYGSGETRVFVAGDGLIEVLNAPHQGYNAGAGPLKLLVFYAGAPGVATAEAVPAPAP